MADASLYERKHMSRREQSSGSCFGVISQVFPAKRLCAVRTFGGTGSLDDQYIPQCQWISLDANPQGDEATTIPRKGSTGIVQFIDGEPFIFGYFRALNKQEGAVAGNEYSGVEGDKITTTIAGNKIIVKRNGMILIECKETLKSIWLPSKSTLIDIMKNWTVNTDGGSFNWTNNDGSTLWNAEYWTSPARYAALQEQKGAAGGTIISRTSVGPAFPGVPGVAAAVYEHTIAITGETSLKVSPMGGAGGVSAKISPTGAITISTGLAPMTQFSLEVTPLGDTTIDVNKQAQFTIDKLGAVKVRNNGGSVDLSIGGDITMKNKLGEFHMTALGKFAAKGATAELLDLFDQVLTQLQKTLAALQVLTVNTGVGVSTPPLNLADFAASMTSVVKIQTLLATIKG